MKRFPTSSDIRSAAAQDIKQSHSIPARLKSALSEDQSPSRSTPVHLRSAVAEDQTQNLKLGSIF